MWVFLVICVGVFGNICGYLGYMCWCLGIGRSQVPLPVRHIHNRLTSTPPGKIRTRYPSCRVAADLRLKSANMQQTKYHFLLYNWLTICFFVKTIDNYRNALLSYFQHGIWSLVLQLAFEVKIVCLSNRKRQCIYVQFIYFVVLTWVLFAVETRTK